MFPSVARLSTGSIFDIVDQKHPTACAPERRDIRCYRL
jgi:hypothetical protein